MLNIFCPYFVATELMATMTGRFDIVSNAHLICYEGEASEILVHRASLIPNQCSYYKRNRVITGL